MSIFGQVIATSISFSDFLQASEPASDVTKDVDLELPDVPTDKIKGNLPLGHFSTVLKANFILITRMKYLSSIFNNLWSHFRVALYFYLVLLNGIYIPCILIFR